MIDRDDLVSLTWEQKKRFRAAINYGYFDNFEDNPRAWRHTLVGALLRKYPERCSTLNRLRDIVGHIPTWEDMTDETLRDFVDDTMDAVAASSARTICAQLKAVLNENKRKIPSEEFVRILSIKGEASQAVYLTREEMQRIIAYKPKTRLERYVRRNFLIEFMTGARRCDAERLTITHCDPETGTLSYVPKKTPGIVVTVPVDERLRLRDLLSDEIKRHVTTGSFNGVLRHICKQCQINDECTIRRSGKVVTAPKWQLVSSHTARRSFATNLYLAGISLEDVALLMGHGKNVETTKRYICADRKLSSNVMAYFRGTEDNWVQPHDMSEYEEEEIYEDKHAWMYEPAT